MHAGGDNCNIMTSATATDCDEEEQEEEEMEEDDVPGGLRELCVVVVLY